MIGHEFALFTSPTLFISFGPPPIAEIPVVSQSYVPSATVGAGNAVAGVCAAVIAEGNTLNSV